MCDKTYLNLNQADISDLSGELKKLLNQNEPINPEVEDFLTNNLSGLEGKIFHQIFLYKYFIYF